MISRDLHDDHCSGCGASLDQAVHYERVDVTYANGELAGEPGVAVIALGRCGMTTVIPFSVNLRRVAA